MFANDATKKGLISKIYKQLVQINNKKTKQPNQKMGRKTKQKFLQKRHTDGQQAHEKMLNIANNQKNANRNNQILPLTGQNACHLKVHRLQMLEKVWRRGNPPTLLAGV